MQAFIPFLLFIVIIGVVIFIVFNFNNSFKKLVTDLGGRINNQGLGVFVFQGREIFVQYTPGSRNRSPELKIYTKGEFGADLLIRYETSKDKFYKQIGLNRELQISDREANDKLYFECDDQEFLN